MLISELGERGLLKLIEPYCLPKTIGDDGAIVRVPPDCQLVVTTDILVDGVHFSDRTTTAFDVGWRSVAANLSDLAAMGAMPLGITVGLSLPPTLPVVWLEQLYAGMQACLMQYGTGIIGGDLTRSSVATVAITALGSARAEQIIARSTARVGDAIVATGYHGDAHAGLQLLLNPELGTDVSNFIDLADLQQHRDQLITAHQRPQPRLDILPILEQLRSSTSQIFPISGMDSSDGLADAIVQICAASGVGAVLSRCSQTEAPPTTIPISPSLAKMFPDTALASALYGGEDFELVLCLPESIALALVEKLNSAELPLHDRGAAIIGKISRHSDILLVNDVSADAPIHLDRQSGFEHF